MKKTSSSSMIPDWSCLPADLLQIISSNLENCFDVVHARSVCSSWRSAYPFPACLSRPSYTFPSFKTEGFCTFEKIPLFLCRVRASTAESASEYFLGGISRDESEDNRMELLSPIQCSLKAKLPSPIQCSVKLKLPGSYPTLMNMLDFQILPLGYQYRRMFGWFTKDWRKDYRQPEPLALVVKDPRLRYPPSRVRTPATAELTFRAAASRIKPGSPKKKKKKDYRRVAFLPLNKEGEFVVLSAYSHDLYVLTSSEMRWMRLEINVTDATCKELVTFRGKFYALLVNGEVLALDPYSLEVMHLQPSNLINNLVPYENEECNLVPCGNDELFLVERIHHPPNLFQFPYKVSRLDEEAGKWVEVTDLGDRVLFIGQFVNVCCSAKNLPDGCGLSGNSFVFLNRAGSVTYNYKYGGRKEDDLNYWRWSKENHVTILHRSPVMSFRVDC